MKDSEEAKGTVTWPAAPFVFPTDLNPGSPSGPHALISRQPFGLHCSLRSWVVAGGEALSCLLASYQLRSTVPGGQDSKAAFHPLAGLLARSDKFWVEHPGWKRIPFQTVFHLHVLTWDLWNVVDVGLKLGLSNHLLYIRRVEMSVRFQTFLSSGRSLWVDEGRSSWIRKTEGGPVSCHGRPCCRKLATEGREEARGVLFPLPHQYSSAAILTHLQYH